MVIYGMSENIFVFSPLFFSFPSLHIPRSPKGNGNPKKERKEKRWRRPVQLSGLFSQSSSKMDERGKICLVPFLGPSPLRRHSPSPLCLHPPSPPHATPSLSTSSHEKQKEEEERKNLVFSPWGRVNLEDRASQEEEEEERGGQSKEQSEKVVLMARGDKLSPTAASTFFFKVTDLLLAFTSPQTG